MSTPSPLPLLPVASAARTNRKPPQHWADLSVDERVEQAVALGLPKFRANQLSQQYFARLNHDPHTMTELPQQLRGQVAEAFFPPLLTQVRKQTADAGTTQKTLWRLFDGTLVESVLMRYPGRATICVSSQAGCGMGCTFCATGQAGLERNLSTAEIVEQIVDAARSMQAGEVPGGPGRLSNVVFMGMGEPLANYRALIAAVQRLVDPPPAGLGMSARNITVSTVGLVPRMRQLAEEGVPVTLALSLHAPDDELRTELVPINIRWGVQETVQAAWEYAQKTRRRVSIEYALIKDINDQGWRADLLGALLRSFGDADLDDGMRGWVHLNLIPLNPTPGSQWTASEPEVEREFVARVRAAGIPTTVRDTRGREIDGACGQLAAEETV